VSHPDRAVRASDAEREDVSRQLSAHAAAGRLTPQELDEPLDAAYAARTYGELTRLLEDLPAAPAAPAEDPARAVARARLAHRAGAAAIASLLCVGIWAAAGASGSFWPIWVILVAAIGLAREGWRTLGPGATLTDEELGERRRRGRARPLAPAAGRNSIIEGREVRAVRGAVVVLRRVRLWGPIARVRNSLWSCPRGWSLLCIDEMR
jgi:hypothetical protein